MKLYLHGTHNNPILKIVLFVFFISFPLIGFILGMQYQEAVYQETPTPILQERPVRVVQEDTERGLIERCGTIPDDVSLIREHFEVINGPLWAPDCRHIAWSLWKSGTGYLGNDKNASESVSASAQQVSARQGVFIYDDATKKTIKIYAPKKGTEVTLLKKWVDRNTIAFIVDESEYRHDLISNTTTLTKQ